MMEGVHSRRQHMGKGGGPEKYKGVGG